MNLYRLILLKFFITASIWARRPSGATVAEEAFDCMKGNARRAPPDMCRSGPARDSNRYRGRCIALTSHARVHAYDPLDNYARGAPLA